MSRAILFLILSIPGWSQVGAPFLGYFVDGTRVRPAHGIPASSSVGGAIDAGDFSLVQAVPGQDFLLAVSAASGEVSLLRPGKGFEALKGVGSAPDAIFPSPRGTAAALWFAASRRIQVVSNLGGAPEVRQVAFVADAPSTLAVSDDGAWVAGLWSGNLRTFGPFGEPGTIALDAPAKAVAFAAASHDLAVATLKGIVRVANLTQPELGMIDGTEDATALAFTPENRTLAAATAGRSLVAIRFDTGAVVRTECNCTPEGLFRLTRSAFRITGLQRNSYLLFDADSGEILTAPLATPAIAEAE